MYVAIFLHFILCCSRIVFKYYYSRWSCFESISQFYMNLFLLILFVYFFETL